MPISIYYSDNKNEITFSCPNIEGPVYEQLIANLTNAGVKFQAMGTDTHVKADEFSSTDDIAEKALAGFSEIEEFKREEHYDHTGTDMTFAYRTVTTSAKNDTQTTLNTSRETAGSQARVSGFRSNIAAFNKNSKDLLDEHYESLRPSMRK